MPKVKVGDIHIFYREVTFDNCGAEQSD